MNNVKVSVIVPVYNAEKYLERTISALCKQTLQEIEIILVDDGSEDNSPVICDQAMLKDDRIRRLHKINAGVSAARNDGMRAARGEYLMFCDADDIPDLVQAEKLYYKAISDDADVVLCGFTRQCGGVDYPELFPYRDPMTSKDEIFSKLIMPMCVWSYEQRGKTFPAIYGSVWRGLYRRGIVSGIDFPEGIVLGEDMIFNIKVWSKCNRISCVTEPLYNYRENDASATHSNSHLLWEKYVKTWLMTHQTLEEIEAGDDNLKWHNYQLCRYATNAIVEGVCTADISYMDKVKLVRNILKNSSLGKARQCVPENLSKKKKLILKTQLPSLAWMLVFYYQKRLE